jgi:hypothetical protein
MARKEIEELLRYHFTPEEKAELSNKLAQACQDRAKLEDDKKAAAAQFKEGIERENANVNQYSRLISNGFELRPTKCYILLNMPVMGTKRIVRADTEETIREVAMTADEYQREIQFVDPQADEKAEQRAKNAEMEKNIRDWFKNPTIVNPETIDVAELTSFKSGEFIIAAANEDEAKAFAEPQAWLPKDFIWVDPDATTFSGFADMYENESRTARAAIAKLYELGKPFPCLLAFPMGNDPQKTDEAQDGAADADSGGKKKRGRPKKTTPTDSTPPAEPETPSDDPIEPTDEDEPNDLEPQD